MLWSKTIVQQQKLVTLRLTGKPSFYIKHDCRSMIDSKFMIVYVLPLFLQSFHQYNVFPIAFKRMAESPATKNGSKHHRLQKFAERPWSPAFSTYS